MKTKLLYSKQAYSMTFWTIFIGFVLVPIFAMTIEIGRYYYARTQISAAADAAALAAAVEIDTATYEATGKIVLTSNAYTWAQKAATQNSDALIALGVNPTISSIQISGTTVKVAVTANLDRLFPSIVPDVYVTEWGTAEVRTLNKK